jgi:hypothetical protein
MPAVTVASCADDLDVHEPMGAATELIERADTGRLQ